MLPPVECVEQSPARVLYPRLTKKEIVNKRVANLFLQNNIFYHTKAYLVKYSVSEALFCNTLTMPLDVKTLPDYHLKLLFAVVNDLDRRSDLANSDGLLTFSNSPKGVTRDEQMAILSNLDTKSYISFSNNGKLLYLNNNVYVGISFTDLFHQVHEEFHKRFGSVKTNVSAKPHYDEVNGILAARVGFEPTDGASKGRCLTTWRPGNS
jgi:hypothetical protein